LSKVEAAREANVLCKQSCSLTMVTRARRGVLRGYATTFSLMMVVGVMSILTGVLVVLKLSVLEGASRALLFEDDAPLLLCEAHSFNLSLSTVPLLPGRTVTIEPLERRWKISASTVWGTNPTMTGEGTVTVHLATNEESEGCPSLVHDGETDWSHYFQPDKDVHTDSVLSSNPQDAGWPEGSTLNLQKHDVNCGNGTRALFRWQIRTSGKTQIRLYFRCRSLAISSCTHMSTPWGDAGEGKAVYLERHNIECGLHEALTQWRLEGDLARLRFLFTCCSVGVGLSRCTEHTTECEESGDGGISSLLRHRVECPPAQVLTMWRLLTETTVHQVIRMYMLFRCCKVGGDTPDKKSILGLVLFNDVHVYQRVQEEEAMSCMAWGRTGFEDPRSFKFAGEDWHIAVRKGKNISKAGDVVPGHTCTTQLAMWPVNRPNNLVPLGLHDAEAWVPFEHAGRLFILYRFRPHSILEVNVETGSCDEGGEYTVAFPCAAEVNLSGGAMASGTVLYRGNRQRLASAQASSGPRHRKTIFYLLDEAPPFQPRFVTQLLRFGKPTDVEALTSIVLEGPEASPTHVLLGWGVNGCRSAFKRVDIRELFVRMRRVPAALVTLPGRRQLHA